MKISFIFVLLISMLLYAGETDKNHGMVYVDEVLAIYDGDTFRCNIKGYPSIVGDNIGIRVAGIDCPEMTDKRPDIKAKAQEAKQFAVKMLREGKTIRLENMHRGKYFRIVADVIIDDKSLSDALLKAGLAKKYDGGTKEEW